MIRKLLEDHIKNNVPDSEVAVLLSGGVDSISVALAAQDAGKNIISYTFHLKDKPSYDALKAKEVSDKMGWECHTVKVPTENLISDWYKLVEHGCRKKTHFECVFPFLYVYPEIQEKYVLTGWAADGYFGPSKKAMMRYSSYKKKRNYVKYCQDHNQKRLNWNEFRIAYLDGDCAGYQQHTKLAENHKKKHITPYKDPKVREYLMGMSWKELNKPRQKEPVRADFPELEEFGRIKQHQNLHLNAGVDKLFSQLIDNPEINFNKRERMMDVCRDHFDKST
tara:strand:+ start:1179 stop:2015 length:837 start_codon:yes stop_codon:yes gene_type:complete